jgi:hypothetical protein
VQLISVPLAVAGNLIPPLQESATFPAAYARLEQMLDQHVATLLGWPVLWLHGDKPALVKNGDELRFRTNFESISGGGFRVPFAWTGGWYAPFPRAFEMRELGVSLEAKHAPSMEDGRLPVTMQVKFTTLLEWKEWASPAPLNSLYKEGREQQPQFASSVLTTSRSLHHREPTLLTVFVLQKPAPQVILCIGRVTISHSPETATF